MKMSNIVKEVTQNNFNELVLDSTLPVLVDFWAPWCAPCRMLAPIVEEVAEEVEGKCLVCKLNVDDCQELAMRFGVMSIPTLILFEKGEPVDKTVGVQMKDAILAMVERHLA